ncbi:MAG TPA: alpha/beta fold hydrolase [Gemmatimonadaceae bacterium]|nr:alpha/beta fold hydrolase [Gemmatimonadaceae bacterium]
MHAPQHEWRAARTHVLVSLVFFASACGAGSQTAERRAVDEPALREYAGVYQWQPNAYVYLQLWNELSGSNQLVAFDEAGDVRTLYQKDRDQFLTGQRAAVAEPVESRIVFQRDSTGRIASLSWQRGDAAPRVARRVDIERHEDVRFSNGSVQLSGTLIRPTSGTRHPAIILVHGSGPATREQILPVARFLVRRGLAVLAYDKRGVGGSTGDWTTATFDDLASDAIAAFEYLNARKDIDGTNIGLFGVSQAGWIMPIAAVKEPKIAFLISVSGPGIPASETTRDHARNEMTARGMKPEVVDQILNIMHLQHEYARTGKGWDAYSAARAELAKRIGPPPGDFPASPDHPVWGQIRRMYFYDPAPTLRRLQTPTLALFGELDNNVLAEKNKAAWESALKEAGHRDYTLRTIPKANHIHLEAKVGNNAEMPSLQRFAPAYFNTISDWLAERIPTFVK